MNILNFIGLLSLFIGLFLDFLTLLWAYKSVKYKTYKSGNFLIPVFFYIFFIFFVNINIINEHTFAFGIFLVSMHLFIYFFIEYFFRKIIKGA